MLKNREEPRNEVAFERAALSEHVYSETEFIHTSEFLDRNIVAISYLHIVGSRCPIYICPVRIITGDWFWQQKCLRCVNIVRAFRHTSLHRCWCLPAAIFATVSTIRAEEARRFRPDVREPGPGATVVADAVIGCVARVRARRLGIWHPAYFLARPLAACRWIQTCGPRDTVVPEVGVVEFLEHFRIVVRGPQGRVERGSDCMPTR